MLSWLICVSIRIGALARHGRQQALGFGMRLNRDRLTARFCFMAA